MALLLFRYQKAPLKKKTRLAVLFLTQAFIFRLHVDFQGCTIGDLKSSTQKKKLPSCWLLKVILPETNSKFAPEDGCLEEDHFFLWGKRPIFRGKLPVSLRESNPTLKNKGKFDAVFPTEISCGPQNIPADS